MNRPATLRRSGIKDRLLTISQLSALPKPEPLIGGVLDQDTLGLLVGYRGTGKSFLALDWGLSVATGRRWQGHDTARQRVLYIAGEGIGGLYQHVHTWSTAWNRNVGDDAFTVVRGAVNLFDRAATTDLAQLVEGDAYGMVIFDTVSRCSIGANENDARDMAVLVDHADAVRNAGHGRRTILLVHHAGLADRGRSRGSTVLEAAADTVHAVEGDMPTFTLTRTKAKDHVEGTAVRLKLVDHPGCESRLVVLDNALDNQGSADKVMSTFLSSFGEGGASKAELRAACGMPAASFYRGVQSLVKAGLLGNTGTDQRPFYKLAGQQ